MSPSIRHLPHRRGRSSTLPPLPQRRAALWGPRVHRADRMSAEKGGEGHRPHIPRRLKERQRRRRHGVESTVILVPSVSGPPPRCGGSSTGRVTDPTARHTQSSFGLAKSLGGLDTPVQERSDLPVRDPRTSLKRGRTVSHTTELCVQGTARVSGCGSSGVRVEVKVPFI